MSQLNSNLLKEAFATEQHAFILLAWCFMDFCSGMHTNQKWLTIIDNWPVFWNVNWYWLDNKIPNDKETLQILENLDIVNSLKYALQPKLEILYGITIIIND